MSETKQLSLREDQLTYLNQFTQKGLALKTQAETQVVEQASDLIMANQIFKQAQALRKDIKSNYKDVIFYYEDFIKQVRVLVDEVGQPGEQAELIISQKILAYNEKVENERRIEAEKEKARLEAVRLQEEETKAALDAEEARIRKIETDRLAKIAAEQEEQRRVIAKEQDANKRAQAEIESKRLEEEAKLEAERVRLDQQKRAMEQQQKDIDQQKKAMDDAVIAKEKADAQAVVDGANKVKGLRESLDFEILNENLIPRAFCSPDGVKIRAGIKSGLREIEGIKIFTKKRIQ